MRSKATPDAGFERESPELGARRRARPRSATGRTVDDAEQCSDRHLGASDNPRPKLPPAPLVHPDFAALAALAVADEERPASRVEVALGEIQASEIRSPARQSTTISPRTRAPCAPFPASRMTATISSTRGGSAGERIPLFLGGRPAW